MQFAASPPPSGASAGVPLWMQVTSFTLAAFLAILKAVEFFRRGKLEVRITRDSFFRLTDLGEALFVHAVLLARNGPVLIQGVTITLKRIVPKGSTTIAEKSFPLEIKNHGEKVKGPGFTAEHHFYGSSPLMYVAAGSTQRSVYYCLQAEYQDRQRQVVVDFDQELLKYKRDVDSAAASGCPKREADVANDVEQIIKSHHAKMCGLIQLEAGEYEVVLSVTYERCGFALLDRQDAATSFIYFTVEGQGLAGLKSALLNTLYTGANNVIRGANNVVIYPEYQPKRFAETTQRKQQ